LKLSVFVPAAMVPTKVRSTSELILETYTASSRLED